MLIVIDGQQIINMKAKKSRVFKQRLIDINNFNEIRNCAMSFQTTPDLLKEAIRAIGPVFDDLQEHFNSHRNPYINRTKGWRL